MILKDTPVRKMRRQAVPVLQDRFIDELAITDDPDGIIVYMLHFMLAAILL